jgi:hypothetical protein
MMSHMPPDNRVVNLSDLRAGDVLKVHTLNSTYRCTITGDNGEATMTHKSRKGKKFMGAHKGVIVGARDSFGRISSGLLRPGARMHFFCVGEKTLELTTSVISRIVVNGGPVLVNFGFRPRLVEWP